jgi:peptidyl-prolyl cis-trans isomerase A (cyclophilin A)
MALSLSHLAAPQRCDALLRTRAAGMKMRAMSIRHGLTLLLASLLPAAAFAAEDPAGGKFTIEEATAGLTGKGALSATIETSQGTFHCELFEKDAPNTVANFVGLARGLRPFADPATGEWVKRPFYDGLIFHRVIPKFMIQGGDPAGSGRGGPGYAIKDETNAPHKFDKAGVMAMANKGPDTAGSQFFITDGATPFLDDGVRPPAHYQIFGQCKEPDVVKKITALRGPGDRPTTEVKIVKVTVDRGGAAGGKAAKPKKK